MTHKLSQLNDSELHQLMSKAQLIEREGRCCPRACGVNRHESTPPCGARADKIIAASFHPHKGEEPPVSGVYGAGNVFVSGCTLSCVFCQNFPFSHLCNGTHYTVEEFCDKLRTLIAKGVHNLNLTTFDHYMSFVLQSLAVMRDEIKIPISNNCSGYFSDDALSIALNFCDIFLYDVKYADQNLADRYSGGKRYVDSARRGLERLIAVKIPWIEEHDILQSGLIVRHLVLPGHVNDTRDVLEYLAQLRDVYSDFRVSLMAQYFPAHRSTEFPEIDRKLSEEEYEEALDVYAHFGFEGWVQELDAEGGC